METQGRVELSLVLCTHQYVPVVSWAQYNFGYFINALLMFL